MNSSNIAGKRDFSELYTETTSEEALHTDGSTLPYTISSSALAGASSSESDRSSPGASSEHSSGEYVSLSRAALESHSSPSRLNQHSIQGLMGSPEGSATIVSSPEKDVYDSDLESESGDEEVKECPILNFEDEETEPKEAKRVRTEALFKTPWELDTERGLSPDIKEIPPTINLGDYLELKGTHRSKIPCGNGSCGKIYAATLDGHVDAEGKPIPYLYKVEKQPLSLARWGDKPQRYSDLAAARLDDLPHLIKPLFLIIQVRVSPNAALRRFYVPIDKAKEFGNTLPAGAAISILTQVLPKAPGKNLGELLQSGKISFDPQDEAGHFRAVLLSLAKFLKNAYPSNFIHRDLKPENIMYDPASGTVTIIDTGLALRLRSRGKEDEEVKGPSNPTTSKQHYGTPLYRSPYVRRKDGYGSEIDFHSMAMVALSLISNDDFEKVGSRPLIEDIVTRKQTDPLFLHARPADFLERYLAFAGGSGSETARALEANPEVKQIIDLAFQISGGGAAGETALHTFETLPYFQES